MREKWNLDPQIVYLNHGSYGATPRALLIEQRRWQDKMEEGPCAFFRALPEALRTVRTRLANFVNAELQGLALIQNATEGTNSVLASLPFERGDEILVSDHGYPAVDASLLHLTHTRGVVIRTAKIPYPLQNHDAVVTAFAEKITKKTKLIIVDHITSATALILPVKNIVALARTHGVPVLIDGAHAPGMLSLDVNDIGADFYVGNLHKWLCTPKGAAFLWVSENYRTRIHPLSISYFYNEGFTTEFDFTGTRDWSATLTIPAAIDFHIELGGKTLRSKNHELVRRGTERVTQALDVPLQHPDSEKFYGSMLSVPLFKNVADPVALAFAVRKHFYEVHHIEVQSQPFLNDVTLRVSAQAYNNLEDFERLAEILRKKPLAITDLLK